MLTIFRFTAPWCAPCRMVAPFFDAFVQEFPDVTFQTVQADDPLPPGVDKVTMIPTVVAVQHGQEIDRITGPTNKKTYAEFIDKYRVSR